MNITTLVLVCWTTVILCHAIRVSSSDDSSDENGLVNTNADERGALQDTSDDDDNDRSELMQRSELAMEFSRRILDDENESEDGEGAIDAESDRVVRRAGSRSRSRSSVRRRPHKYRSPNRRPWGTGNGRRPRTTTSTLATRSLDDGEY
jgi:hypothetical protein